MRILFLSDIHGNKQSLDFLKTEKFNQLIVLGDIYGYGYEPEKDQDTVNELLNYKDKMLCIKGNSDVNNSNLFSPSKSIQFTIDNILFRCDHGDTYNYHSGSFIKEKGVLLFGHEHVPYIHRVGDMIYACVGSVGKPRSGSPASYAVYEKNTLTLYTLDKKVIDSVVIS